MHEESIARVRQFADWLAADRVEANGFAAQMLALPAQSWDAWLAQHPEAQTIEALEALLDTAAEAMAVTDFVLEHAGTVRVPNGAEILRDLVAGRVWRLRGDALAKAGRQEEAERAYAQSESALRAEGGGERGLASRLLRETRFGDWPALAGREDLRNIGALEQLSREAAARAQRMPLESLAIAQLAVNVAARIAPGTYPPAVMAQFRARTAKELGIVCRYMGRHQEALNAYDEAEQILTPHQELAHDRAIIQLARASTLQELNRFDEAAVEIARCRVVFDRLRDRRRQLICGVVEGTLLHRQGRYREAVDAYLRLLDPVSEIGDLDMLASLHNNIAHSAVEIGEFDTVRRHLDAAIGLFQQLEAPMNVARTELARGRLFLRMGDAASGITHLQNVREQFLRHGLVEEAGLCGLDLVEAMLSSGEYAGAETLARQIVREFAAAQLKARAIKALGYLSEAIAARQASGATVERVRRFLNALDANPDLEFVA